jgi:hypothetical protein
VKEMKTSGFMIRQIKAMTEMAMRRMEKRILMATGLIGLAR